MKTKFFLAIIAVMLSLGVASAQNTDSKTTKAETKKGCFVDANKNGICDNFESKTCTRGDGSGLQNGKGSGCCKGEGAKNGNGHKHRHGKGHKHGNGKGQGQNFVDENKNGVCDHNEKKTN